MRSNVHLARSTRAGPCKSPLQSLQPCVCFPSLCTQTHASGGAPHASLCSYKSNSSLCAHLSMPACVGGRATPQRADRLAKIASGETGLGKVRQHVNPLSPAFRDPIPTPNWAQVSSAWPRCSYLCAQSPASTFGFRVWGLGWRLAMWRERIHTWGCCAHRWCARARHARGSCAHMCHEFDALLLPVLANTCGIRCIQIRVYRCTSTWAAAKGGCYSRWRSSILSATSSVLFEGTREGAFLGSRV